MDLRTTEANRCLERKLLLCGYEIPDLLAIFLLLSVLNFILGPLGNRFLLVWAPSLAFAIALRFGKAGKPDNFLLHWIRFQLMPKRISAFSEFDNWPEPLSLERKI